MEAPSPIQTSPPPLQYVQFQPFTRRGYLLNFDGEIFARKGLASARIRFHDLTVDVFTSHFASYRDDPRTNGVVRRLQGPDSIALILFGPFFSPFLGPFFDPFFGSFFEIAY